MSISTDLRHEREHRRPMSISDVAAEWLMRWHCGDLTIAERYEYLQWLKTSPVHVAETLRLCRLYSFLDDAKPLPFDSGAAVDSAEAPSKPPHSTMHSPADREYVGVRRRSIATVMAILSIGFGALTMTGAALQQVSEANGEPATSDVVEKRGRDRGIALPTGCQDSQSTSADECTEPGARKWSRLQRQGVCAFAVAVPLMLWIVIRRRRLTLADVGPLFATFMAGGGIPVSLELCSVVLPIPRDPGVVIPDQYALQVAAAGLALLVISGITICTFYAAQASPVRVTSSHADVSSPNTSRRKPKASKPDEEQNVG